MSWRYLEKGFERGPVSLIIRLGVVVLCASCIVGALSWGIGLLSQPGKIIEKTMDADNVIYNYEWFKEAYNEIEATDLKIQNASSAVALFKDEAGSRTDWTFEDKNEYSRLNTIFMGLQNYRISLAAKYNARSKMVNRKIFKGRDCPFEIL